MAGRAITITVDDIEDDDLICSAVLVVSVLSPNDVNPHIQIDCTEGMSSVKQVGLLRIAEQVALNEASYVEDDE